MPCLRRRTREGGYEKLKGEWIEKLKKFEKFENSKNLVNCRQACALERQHVQDAFFQYPDFIEAVTDQHLEHTVVVGKRNLVKPEAAAL